MCKWPSELFLEKKEKVYDKKWKTKQNKETKKKLQNLTNLKGLGLD